MGRSKYLRRSKNELVKFLDTTDGDYAPVKGLFTFDDDDQVKSVEVRGLDEARDIPLVKRTTPDLGHDDNAVKEIFGNVGKIHRGQVAPSR